MHTRHGHGKRAVCMLLSSTSAVGRHLAANAVAALRTPHIPACEYSNAPRPDLYTTWLDSRYLPRSDTRPRAQLILARAPRVALLVAHEVTKRNRAALPYAGLPSRQWCPGPIQ